MQITEISASWGETVNLGNYENARVDLRMTARLEPGADVARAYDDLLHECRLAVQEEADRALERADQPAKYSTQPRYDVLRRSGLVAIVPAGLDLPESYRARYGLRLGHAERVAQKLLGQRDAMEIATCRDAAEVATLAERLRAEDAQKRAAREAAWAAQDTNGDDEEDEDED